MAEVGGVGQDGPPPGPDRGQARLAQQPGDVADPAAGHPLDRGGHVRVDRAGHQQKLPRMALV